MADEQGAPTSTLNYSPLETGHILKDGRVIRRAPYLKALTELTSSGDAIWLLSGQTGRGRGRVGTTTTSTLPSQWDDSVVSGVNEGKLLVRYNDGGFLEHETPFKWKIWEQSPDARHAIDAFSEAVRANRHGWPLSNEVQVALVAVTSVLVFFVGGTLVENLFVGDNDSTTLSLGEGLNVVAFFLLSVGLAVFLLRNVLFSSTLRFPVRTTKRFQLPRPTGEQIRKSVLWILSVISTGIIGGVIGQLFWG